MVQAQIQNRFIELANNSCYALCLIQWMNNYRKMGLTRGSDYFRLVIEAYRNDWIDYDGTVSNPAAFLSYIDPKHANYKVTYIPGNNFTSECYPTFFSINGKDGHFVLSTASKITWNPLSYSKNVTYGKAVSYRKIELC